MNKTAALSCALITMSAGLAHADLVSGGFEMGPTVASTSFAPTDSNMLGWFASNTDGERLMSATGRMAAEGDYYASLLQNAGAYDGSQLGVGDFGFTGFDRIYATMAVSANTTYTVSFLHAGDDRFGYFAGTSVVEVVDTGDNSTLSQQMFATPGFFDWQSETFTFTTGATTSEIAVAFTVMGSANTSGVFDGITVVPAPGTGLILASALLLPTRRRRR